MIWVILAALGVPLWLCAIGALVLILNNRRLRHRRGNIPVRVLPPGKTRWKRGHAIWVSNVFAWRSSPAGWNEDILDVGDVKMRAATREEHDKLRHLADEPAVVTLTLASGTTLDVAAQPEYRAALSGPWARSPRTPERLNPRRTTRASSSASSPPWDGSATNSGGRGSG